MKLLLTIVFSILISLKALSQTTDPADSIWTFTAEPDPFHDICNAGVGKAFKVLSSNYKLPVNTIFISFNNLLLSSYKDGATFTIKGRITVKKELVNGCFSARWEESRTYINPIYLYRHLKFSDLNL